MLHSVRVCRSLRSAGGSSPPENIDASPRQVHFNHRDTAPGELSQLTIPPEVDLSEPFLDTAAWQHGHRGRSPP